MKDAGRLMYAYLFPIMYSFYALCRKNTKRFVNNEIAPFRVLYITLKLCINEILSVIM